MTESFDGLKLVDSAGDAVGSVERTYLDDSGAVKFLEVKMGTILSRSRLVPGDAAQVSNGTVRVPYTKEAIEESPGVKSGDTLEGSTLESVQSYYSNELDEKSGDIPSEPLTDIGESANGTDENIPPAQSASSPEMITTVGETDERNRPASDYGEIPREATPPHFGEVRDLGDVIEVPIVEEVLIKKPIVREVLRIRKSHSTEKGIAGADLRKETVEVISNAGADVEDSTGTLKRDE
ncbi:MAG: hypothetical protein NVSMB52_01610 [Chloroflexota bacterium]